MHGLALSYIYFTRLCCNKSLSGGSSGGRPVNKLLFTPSR